MGEPDMTLLDRRILSGMPAWVGEIICDCAARERVSPSDVILVCRAHAAVRARHEAIYLVKAMKPHLSASRIGLWFRRDHTTILYALAKYQAKHRMQEFTNYSRIRRAA